MDDLDPHLTILLRDFVGLCPEDMPVESDDWTGLYEICAFVHEQQIPCPASTLREFFLLHGCSPHKAMFLSTQYDHFLQMLTWRHEHTPRLPVHAREDFRRGLREEV